MNAQRVLRKTAKGNEEIEHRTHRLPIRARRVLIMIDGRRTLWELTAAAANDPLEEIVAMLLEEGFAEADSAEGGGGGVEGSFAGKPRAATHSVPGGSPSTAPSRDRGRSQLSG